jgi:hypothetical protein
MRSFLIIFVILFQSVNAFAVELPAAYHTLLRNKQSYGDGIYTRWGLKGYDAALWTDAKPFAWERPFLLRLAYHWDFSRDDIVKESLKQMQHIGVDAKRIGRYATLLPRCFPDVKEGDSIAAFARNQDVVVFYHNDAVFFEARSEGIANDFMGIWLSAQTSAPSLRQRLLKL